MNIYINHEHHVYSCVSCASLCANSSDFLYCCCVLHFEMLLTFSYDPPHPSNLLMSLYEAYQYTNYLAYDDVYLQSKRDTLSALAAHDFIWPFPPYPYGTPCRTVSSVSVMLLVEKSTLHWIWQLHVFPGRLVTSVIVNTFSGFPHFFSFLSKFHILRNLSAFTIFDIRFILFIYYFCFYYCYNKPSVKRSPHLPEPVMPSWRRFSSIEIRRLSWLRLRNLLQARYKKWKCNLYVFYGGDLVKPVDNPRSIPSKKQPSLYSYKLLKYSLCGFSRPKIKSWVKLKGCRG
jgi:hypothetical protein